MAHATNRRSLIETVVAATRDNQRVFDDLVELGLAAGTLNPILATYLVRGILTNTATRTSQKTPY
jgi:hypothetical protein